MTVKAKLRAKLNETGNRLFTTLNFRNFTLCATKDKNISFDISYQNYFVRNYGCEVSIAINSTLRNIYQFTNK